MMIFWNDPFTKVAKFKSYWLVKEKNDKVNKEKIAAWNYQWTEWSADKMTRLSKWLAEWLIDKMTFLQQVELTNNSLQNFELMKWPVDKMLMLSYRKTSLPFNNLIK